MARLGKRERAALKLTQAGRKPRNFANNVVAIRTSMSNMWPHGKASKQWGYSGNTAKRVHHASKR